MAVFTILLISALNVSIVYAASWLGIHGDGTSGAMPLVWGLGLIWVGGFTIRSLQLAWRGDGKKGISLCAKALPLAFLFIILGQVIWVMIHEH